MVISGCATPPEVPFCGPTESLPPPPAAACASDPEVAAYAERVFRPVVDDMRTVLFRVGFDADARIGSICAERARTPDLFTARHEVAEGLGPLATLPPGPACLAGTRLDLNEPGALRVDVSEAVEGCIREASASGGAVSLDDVGFRQCVLWTQRQRGEIWLFDRLGTVTQVYGERPEAAERRTAIKRCVDARLYAHAREDAPPLPNARRDPRIDTCMQELGWEPRLNPAP